MRLRLILRLFLGMTAALAAALPAEAVSIYANGGSYFTAYGPAANWRRDWGEGYCGKYGAWCSPKQFQWTYNNKGGYGAMNSAVWRTPPSQVYSRAFAFVPRKDATTAAAPYTVSYAYVSIRQSIIDQSAYFDQWVPLANGDSLYRIENIDLLDNTNEPSWTKIAFDEIKIEN